MEARLLIHAEEQVDAFKRLTPRPVQAVQKLLRYTASEAGRLANRAASGQDSPREFGDRMATLLERAHTQAVVLGRNHAGDQAPEEADDREFAARVVDGEAEFLAGFVEDLAAGRYEGNPDAVVARARMYAARLVGTANEAFVLASDDTLWTWKLGTPEVGHCESCPKLAAGSPYTTAKLPTYPRAGGTPCVFNCTCSLIRADGREGFTVPD